MIAKIASLSVHLSRAHCSRLFERGRPFNRAACRRNRQIRLRGCSRKADNRKVNEIYGYSTSIPSILWVDGEWRKDDDGIHSFSTKIFHRQRIIFQVFFEKINSPEKIIAPLLHSRIGEEIARRFQKLNFLSPKKIGINETRWDRCVLGGNWNRTGALLELEEVWYACKHAQPCVQGRCMCLVH